MSYNPSYGGQFQGLSAIQKKGTTTEKKGAAKWIKATDADAGGETQKIPKKVICTFKSLTCVKMPPVAAGDRRDFFAAAVFENDDLAEVADKYRRRESTADVASVLFLRELASNFVKSRYQVMKRSRCRTPVMQGMLQNELWHASFKDARLVLPIVDPTKRIRFYVCAITTTHHEEEGRRTRDIALMGIGYTASFFMDQCKDFGTSVMELKPVQDGDESITPGKLEVAVRCCMPSEGPSIPEDVESSVLEAFQAKLDEELKKKTEQS